MKSFTIQLTLRYSLSSGIWLASATEVQLFLTDSAADNLFDRSSRLFWKSLIFWNIEQKKHFHQFQECFKKIQTKKWNVPKKYKQRDFTRFSISTFSPWDSNHCIVLQVTNSMIYPLKSVPNYKPQKDLWWDHRVFADQR